ncbi:MAG: HEAT repeat domain-containing protein [Clostridia bacterium]|nr:HEAT repeat domain-containing protein [Deltaproteobacteria bacterium]
MQRSRLVFLLRCVVLSGVTCPFVALLGVTVLSVTACNNEPSAIKVTRLLLNLPPDLDNDAITRAGILADITKVLNDDRTTRFKLNDYKGTHALRVDVAAPPRPNTRGHRPDDDAFDPPEPPAQRVREELRALGDAQSYDVVGRASVTENMQADVKSAYADGWAVMTAMRRLDTSDERDMISALASSDDRLQLFAAQRLGERKSKAAVDPLITLLNEKTRPELALRAIGALVRIGDSRAAEPMIDLASKKDPHFVLQVVFALGALGGPTAEGYLVTLASGHPVEAVRRGAEDALAELARRHPQK